MSSQKANKKGSGSTSSIPIDEMEPGTPEPAPAPFKPKDNTLNKNLSVGTGLTGGGDGKIPLSQEKPKGDSITKTADRTDSSDGSFEFIEKPSCDDYAASKYEDEGCSMISADASDLEPNQSHDYIDQETKSPLHQSTKDLKELDRDASVGGKLENSTTESQNAATQDPETNDLKRVVTNLPNQPTEPSSPLSNTTDVDRTENQSKNQLHQKPEVSESQTEKKSDSAKVVKALLLKNDVSKTSNDNVKDVPIPSLESTQKAFGDSTPRLSALRQIVDGNMTNVTKSSFDSTQSSLDSAKSPTQKALNSTEKNFSSRTSINSNVKSKADLFEKNCARDGASTYNLRPRKDAGPILSLNLAQRDETYGMIKVVFHAVVSPDFKIDVDKHHVYIIFGNPISDFTECKVEMKPTGTSKYAVDNGILYCEGILYLEPNFVDKQILYKYVVVRNIKKRPEYEYIDVNTKFPAFNNRCFTIPKNFTRTFHQFDDVIHTESGLGKNHGDFKVKVKENAFVSLLSRINTRLIQAEGVVEAIKQISEIRKRYSAKNGMKIVCQKDHHREDRYLNIQWKEEVAMSKYMKVILKSFHKQCELDNEQGKLKMAFFLCLLTGTTDGNFQKSEEIYEIFKIFKQNSSDFLTKNVLTDFFPHPEDAAIICKALVQAINKYFYFLDSSPNFRPNDFGIWIFCLPIIYKLQNWNSNQRIQIDIWRKIDERNQGDFALLAILDSYSAVFPYGDELAGSYIENLSSEERRQLLFTERYREKLRYFPRGILLSGFLLYMDSLIWLKCPSPSERKEFFAKCLEQPGQRLPSDVLVKLKNFLSWKGRKMFDVQLFAIEILYRFEEPEEASALSMHFMGVLHENEFCHVFPYWNQLLLMISCYHDGNTESLVWKKLMQLVSTLEADDCLLCLFGHGEILDQELENLFLNQAFSSNTWHSDGWFKKMKSKISSFTGFGLSEKSRLMKIIEKIILKFSQGQHPEELMKSLCESDIPRKVLEQVRELEPEAMSQTCKNAIGKISHSVGNLVLSLSNDSMTLAYFQYFTEDFRLKRICQLANTLLTWIPNFPKLPDNEFFCSRKIKMKSLEMDLSTMNNSIDIIKSVGREKLSSEALKDYFPPNLNNVLISQLLCVSNAALLNIKKEEELALMNWLIFSYRKSQFVDKFLRDEINKKFESNDEEFLTPSDVLVLVQVVKGHIEDIAKDLNDESMLVEKAQILFQKFYETSHLDEEINGLSNVTNIKFKPDLIQRIRMIFQMQQLERIAVVTQELRLALDQKQELMVVKRILQAAQNKEAFKQEPIGAMNDDVIKKGSIFNKWTPEELNCLDALRRSKKLVDWVKSMMHSLQELKVWVDLASISAGESDQEVDQVSIFQKAIQGYSPLIFDLNPNSSQSQFLESCQTVFANLKSDPKIPQSIKDATRFLGWLQEVSDRHGSVEASSLNIVENVQKTGIFLLTTGQSNTFNPRLKYQVQDEEKGDREMAYEDISELRSKLMLVSIGEEGKKHVDRFVAIFNQIEVIMKVLNKLLAAGCHLFSQLTLKAMFNEKKKVKLSLDFSNKNAPISGCQPVEQELNTFANFLNFSLYSWNDYISELRVEYPCLNLFTTDQLVILSSSLARLHFKTTQLSSESKMLLKFADEQSFEEINLNELLKEVIGDVEEVKIETKIVDDSDHEKNQEYPLKHLAAFKELCVDYGYDEDLALASLINFKCKRDEDVDMEVCSTWCEDNQSNDNAIKDLLEEIEVGPEPKGLEPQGELNSLLSDLWSGFMTNMNQMGAVEFLDFGVLSKVLQHYVDFSQESLNRPLPIYMKKGQPNLVVCPEKDVYKIALSTYVLDKDIRPPGLDEVLICTSETTVEQVELLCRRAFNDGKGKIFTVLHSHELNFDVSTKVEEIFSSHQSSQEYQIVFISSKECNDVSYISTAFDKYTINIPNPLSDEELSSYLRNHLKIPEGIDTAAKFDPERSWLRVIMSDRSGNGKTLAAKGISKRNHYTSMQSYQIHDDTINIGDCIDSFQGSQNGRNLVYHLDVSSMVKSGKNDMLFSLSVMRGLQNHSGKIWVMSSCDAYLIELLLNPKDSDVSFANLLPQLKCLSPQEVFQTYQENPHISNSWFKKTENQYVQLFDFDIYESAVIQRTYQYLSLYTQKQELLEHFTYSEQVGREYIQDSLKILLKFCPVEKPTWCEIMHFASFLNVQLESTEKSVFCNSDIIREDLPGFKTFVVQFLIQMSQDFASRSVEISDESQKEGFSKPVIKKRRKWENSPHPYIFFNEDRETISFFGFHLDQSRNLVCEVTNKILKGKVMSAGLYQGLQMNRVTFNKQFNNLTREEKLRDLCLVFGVAPIDPDPSYELTYDNVMKMMAIQMRFRSNIPVIIMGETGSGKTRLIKFMCDLQKNRENVENMLILKTHGGVTADTITKKTMKAISTAEKNIRRNIKQTILFFDEANTTNAIGMIKTLMCDSMLNGKPIPENIGLQFVVAVNPYREHSSEMIKKLENAGLGYHISMEKTQDRIGKIPMRRLVYRVKEMPESMFPLVWDFGTLDDRTEGIYIRQMISQRVLNGNLPQGCEGILLEVLCESQSFMRKMKDECSFVSLRDVERTLKVLEWFETKHHIVHNELEHFEELEDFVVSLVLALGVTYYVRLEKRDAYEDAIIGKFQGGYNLGKRRNFSRIINACQDLFVNALQLGDNIAKNDALKENVWMMSICIELKIPLFLVGKPGSSKSLAKTVITDAMQGEKSYSDLFKNFKDIHMISFQCSPLATAGGILGAFRQCQKFQSQKVDLNSFTAVVVLDEVGLAEDSDKMPLKALHPLLEDGCIDDEEPAPYKKVSFIGISNWALDPAKMNRGILVSRGVPMKEDLIKSAEGICSNDARILNFMKLPIFKLTNGYDFIHSKQDREYFGLRDFYSVVKMVFNFAKQRRAEPTPDELKLAVQRNFGGYFGSFDPAFEFLEKIGLADAPLLPPKNLIMEAIRNGSSESRYVLLLTKNNVALRIIQDESLLDPKNTLVIFGSSFPHDQEYTQICSNINRIKISMELGQTVVLCNLTNLYESLYDALNQNYVMLGGKRYVDLGLGTHRVKCRVHENFRLIVVAEDEEVYKKFPIPLINRLEKHFLGMDTMISKEHQDLVKDLKMWAVFCSEVNLQFYQYKNVKQFQPGDVFIGYNDDVIAAMVLRLLNLHYHDVDQIEHEIKMQLLQCATPDAIIRIAETKLDPQEKQKLFTSYYIYQKHGSLSEFLKTTQDKKLLQITTSSRILTQSGAKQVAQELGIRSRQIDLLSLQQFDTEEQFRDRVKKCVNNFGIDKQYLFVQAELGNPEGLKLVECARYIIQDLIKLPNLNQNLQIVLILHIPRVAGGMFNGLSIHPWTSCHIDELRHDEANYIDVSKLEDETIYEVFRKEYVNFESLVKSCLPKSVSLIQFNAHGQMDQRIKIMVDLFDEEKQTNNYFAQRMRRLILDFVIHKVGMRCQEMLNPKKWLMKMTISSSHLKEGNTFQKSVWLFLCDFIIPILTEIITFCDLQEGLKFTFSTNQVIQQLYLSSLSTAKHQIDNFSFPTTNFQSKFPFSSFIVNFMESNHEQLNKETMTNSQLQTVLDKSQLQDVFKTAQQNDLENLKNFIFDFVCLKFSALENEKLTEFMFTQLFRLSKSQQSIRLDEMTVVEGMSGLDLNGSSEASIIDEERMDDNMSLCDVYLAFVKNTKRLSFMASLIMEAPELINLVDCEADQEYTCDLDLYAQFLSLSEPNIDEMVREQKRLHYFNKMNQVSAYYHQYLTLDISNTEAISTKKNDIVEGYRRLRILGSFIKNLSKTSGDLIDVVYSCGKRLNVVMKKNQLQSGPEFQKFVSFLHFVNEKVWRVFFNFETDSCIICKEDMQDPVILSCKHVGCQGCLHDFVTDRSVRNLPKICPVDGCDNEIEDGFKLESTQHLQRRVQQHLEFKNLLKEFFLDVLQKFVFVRGFNPDDKIIKTLMSFVVTKELPKDDHKRNRTKQISPFDGHCIDVTPVIRSFILQLMLHGDSFDLWYAHLEIFIEEERKFVHKSPREFGELCLLIVYCLEDQHMVKLRPLKEKFVTNPTIAMDEAVQLLSNLNLDKRYEHLGKILANIAKARIAMNTVAVVLHRIVEEETCDEGEAFLDHVTRVILDKMRPNSYLRKLLVRLLVSQFRKDFILEWKESQKYIKLLPDELIQSSFENKVDNFLILGDSYKNCRDLLKKCLAINKHEELIAFFNRSPNVLAELELSLYFTKYLSSTKLNMNNINTLVTTLRDSEVPKKQLEIFETSLMTDEPLRRIFKIRNGKEEIVLALIKQLEVSFKYQKHKTVFSQIAVDPSLIHYMPTMPQDDSVEIKNATREVTRWYCCANGHPYGIGNCGQPVAGGKCGDCGAKIGAGDKQYAFADNGQNAEQRSQAQFRDHTKVGHILDVARPDSTSIRVRDLDGIQVAISRFLLHASMSVACIKNQQLVLNVVSPTIPPEVLPTFLMDHMTTNLQQISKLLGRNLDDVAVLMHSIILKMQKNKFCGGQVRFDNKQARQQWENTFGKEIITPMIKILPETVQNFVEILENDQSDAKSALEVILHENSLDFDQSRVVEQPCFWFPRDKISIDNVGCKVGAVNMSKRCPLFSKLMNKRPILEEMQNLPCFIKMFQLFIKKFNRKIDSSKVESDNMNIVKFVYQEENFTRNEKDFLKEAIPLFINAFNNLRNEIAVMGKVGRDAMKSCQDKNIGLDSPAAFLFPSMHKSGSVSKALVQLLIQTQNEVVGLYCDVNGIPPAKSIPQGDIRDGDVIVFDKDSFYLYLLTNSEYKLNVNGEGKQTQWYLNELGFERDIADRYIAGRPKIEEQQRQPFFYQNDDKTRHLHLGAMIPQTKLRSSLKSQLQTELKKLVDVCDLLDDCTTLRNFLLVTGGKAESSLCKGMERFHLKPEQGVRALKQLHFGELEDLIDFLAFLRAWRMIAFKQDPFGTIHEYRQTLPEAVVDKQISILRKRLNVGEFLPKLHQYILIRLGQHKDEPKASLGGYMSYFLLQDNETSLLADEIDRGIMEEVKNEHAIDLFTKLVQTSI